MSSKHASRGVRTADRSKTKPPRKLTDEELVRLDRQRDNKRRWARKEREKYRRELENLKRTNEARKREKQTLQEQIEELLKWEGSLKDALENHGCNLEPHGTSGDAEVLPSISLGYGTASARGKGVCVSQLSRRSTCNLAISTMSGDTQESSNACSEMPRDRIKPSSPNFKVPSSIRKSRFATRSAPSKRENITVVNCAASSGSKHCGPVGCLGTSINKKKKKAKPRCNSSPGCTFLPYSQAISNEDKETDQNNQELSIDTILKAAKATKEPLEVEPDRPSNTAGEDDDCIEAIIVTPESDQPLTDENNPKHDFPSSTFIVNDLQDNTFCLQLFQDLNASTPSQKSSSSFTIETLTSDEAMPVTILSSTEDIIELDQSLTCEATAASVSSPLVSTLQIESEAGIELENKETFQPCYITDSSMTSDPSKSQVASTSGRRKFHDKRAICRQPRTSVTSTKVSEVSHDTSPTGETAQVLFAHSLRLPPPPSIPSSRSQRQFKRSHSSPSEIFFTELNTKITHVVDEAEMDQLDVSASTSSARPAPRRMASWDGGKEGTEGTSKRASCLSLLHALTDSEMDTFYRVMNLIVGKELDHATGD